jgi:transposase
MRFLRLRRRFGVSASSAIRRQALRRLGGDGRPKPQSGDRLSQRTEQHGDLIRALLVETTDITLPELKERLAQSGAQLSVAALWRLCKRHKLTRKRPRTRVSRIGRRPEAARGLVQEGDYAELD